MRKETAKEKIERSGEPVTNLLTQYMKEKKKNLFNFRLRIAEALVRY
jgi:hypothetical protein